MTKTSDQERRSKLIHLSENAIKTLSIDAVKKGKNFKVHAEDILEAFAEKINKKAGTLKSGVKN